MNQYSAEVWWCGESCNCWRPGYTGNGIVIFVEAEKTFCETRFKPEKQIARHNLATGKLKGHILVSCR